MADLTDELLKLIAAGSGRCYPHEGKAMALELLQWRKKAAEAAAKALAASAASPLNVGQPFPFHP